MKFLLTSFIIFALTWKSLVQADAIRPLYIFGHMANNIQTVDRMLAKGANAIETDLKFNKATGLAEKFYHGIPCDCFRSCNDEENPERLMAYIRDLSTPGHNNYRAGYTGVMWIDLKLKGVPNLEPAGQAFAGFLIRVFQTKGSKLKLVLALEHPDHFSFLKGVVEKLRQVNNTDVLGRIVASGYEAKYINAYIAANKALGLPPLWLDEGLPNCLTHAFSLLYLKKAIMARDDGNDVSKVCRWTTDLKSHMRNAMRLGVDSIITNDPNDLLEVVNEREFRGVYRLATAEDNPFERIKGHGPYALSCAFKRKWYAPWTGNYQCWRDTNISGSWCYTTRKCDDDPSACSITDPCE